MGHPSCVSSQVPEMTFLLLSRLQFLLTPSHPLSGCEWNALLQPGTWLPEQFPRGQWAHWQRWEGDLHGAWWRMRNERQGTWQADLSSFLPSMDNRRASLSRFEEKALCESKHVCPGNCAYLSWTQCEAVASTIMTGIPPCLSLHHLVLSPHLHYPEFTGPQCQQFNPCLRLCLLEMCTKTAS